MLFLEDVVVVDVVVLLLLSFLRLAMLLLDSGGTCRLVMREEEEDEYFVWWCCWIIRNDFCRDDALATSRPVRLYETVGERCYTRERGRSSIEETPKKRTGGNRRLLVVAYLEVGIGSTLPYGNKVVRPRMINNNNLLALNWSFCLSSK